jgi:predicted RNA-binding Zn-ribbon protein involved in translation (DUF1610 family)
MSKTEECDRWGNFSGYEEEGFIICAMHPTGPDAGAFCPDWALVEDDGWFLDDEAEVDGELGLAQATLLEALERNIEIMLHPKITGRCPDCGAEFDRRQSQPVHWDCDRCGWMDDNIDSITYPMLFRRVER